MLRPSRSLPVFAVVLLACKSPATQVLFTINTDIERPLTVRAIVFEGAVPPSEAAARAHARGAALTELGAPVRAFPYELGVSPKAGSARRGAVTVVLTVHSDATATQPALDFDRPLHAEFVEGTRQDAPVWLRLACSATVSGCTTPGVSCTLAQRCTESGRVCDDNGVCGSPIVVQTPYGADASMDARDARDALSDAPRDAEASAPWDHPAPRSIAPLSTARVSVRRPLFRWQLAAGATEARLELFADRACTRPLGTIDATDSARPTSDLPPGWVFWRLRSRDATRLATRLSPVWQAWIPASNPSADRDSICSSVGDFNGDGLADLVIGNGAAGGTLLGEVSIYNGRAGGIASTPSQTLHWMTGNGFGKAVTSAGDVNGDGFADLVVGAWTLSTPTKPRCGGVFVFHGGPDGLNPAPSTIIEGTSAEERFGMNVAGLGDVNGDGYSDIIAGGSGQNIPRTPGNPGVARLFYGSASGVDPGTEVYWRFGQMTDWFGHDVTALGDVNADGFADFAVSAPWADSTPWTDNGRALVVMGAPGFTVIGPGRQATAGQWYPGVAQNERFGGARSAGDFDHDGYCDMAFVGDSTSADARGRVELHRGGPMGLEMTAHRTLTGAAADDQLGFSGSLAGDVTGDGIDDLLLGACTSTQGATPSSGFAALYAGSTNGIGPTPLARWIATPPSGGLFGFSASIVGDMDGDNIADFAISEPYVTVAGRMQNGRVLVGYGGAMIRFPAVTVQSNTARDMFGYMVGR